jgi:hypothetical protein
MSPARHLLTLLRGAYGTARFVARHPPLRLATFACLALAATWPLLSTAAMLNDFRDANVLAHYESAARESILRWHQAPLWDPYYCGGMYLLGTPQARFVSPTFLFTLLFGEARGEALTAFSMLIVGLEGTYRYMRDRKATRFGALLAAPLFALSGIFAVSPALGWIGFFGFELLPWMALGVRRALLGERKAIVLLAVAAAWCVGFGGTYAAPLSALWCAFEVAEVAARKVRRDRRRLAVGLGVTLAGAALAVGLSAVRLWPILHTLVEAPRIIGGTPGNGAMVLTRMFFFPTRPESDDGEFYVGFFVLPAALFGFARRRSLGLGLAALLSAWLSAGYEISPSLFAALRELPLYTSLRYPERFLILFGLAMTTLAARGISLLETWVRASRTKASPRRRWWVAGAWAVVSLALVVDVGPLVAQHLLHARQRPLIPPPASAGAGRPFHQARGTRWALAQYEPMARGSLSCWEAYPVPESPLLRGDLVEEETVSPPAAGTLTERSWSPGAIDLDVELAAPATVAINQNWDPGWRASVGEVKSDHGLLTVELPAGAHALSLRFEPRSALGGALASLVAAAGLVFLGLRARRSPTVSTARDGAALALIAVLPVVPVLVIAAAVHQKHFVEPLLTPDGRPVVADALDEGAVRIDTRFDDGIVLEAATLSDPEPAVGSDLTLELDWRRTGGVDPGLGVFVHMEPSSGNGLNGDHVLLSGVLDLQDAPADRTLRDVIPLFIPDDARGKKWKVWVGLWHVRRGGSRVGVADAGHAQVEGGRVMALSFTPH